jgi:hypothetical protein
VASVEYGLGYVPTTSTCLVHIHHLAVHIQDTKAAFNYQAPYQTVHRKVQFNTQHSWLVSMTLTAGTFHHVGYHATHPKISAEPAQVLCVRAHSMATTTQSNDKCYLQPMVAPGSHVASDVCVHGDGAVQIMVERSRQRNTGNRGTKPCAHNLHPHKTLGSTRVCRPGPSSGTTSSHVLNVHPPGQPQGRAHAGRGCSSAHPLLPFDTRQTGRGSLVLPQVTCVVWMIS